MKVGSGEPLESHTARGSLERISQGSAWAGLVEGCGIVIPDKSAFPHFQNGLDLHLGPGEPQVLFSAARRDGLVTEYPKKPGLGVAIPFLSEPFLLLSAFALKIHGP